MGHRRGTGTQRFCIGTNTLGHGTFWDPRKRDKDAKLRDRDAEDWDIFGRLGRTFGTRLSGETGRGRRDTILGHFLRFGTVPLALAQAPAPAPGPGPSPSMPLVLVLVLVLGPRPGPGPGPSPCSWSLSWS